MRLHRFPSGGYPGKDGRRENRGGHPGHDPDERVRVPGVLFLDAIPEPDYRGEITDLSSRTVSSSAIELWWNNTGVEDTGYEIFVSGLPETGYTLLKTVGIDVENKASDIRAAPGYHLLLQGTSRQG